MLTHDGAAALQLGFHPGSGSQRPLFVDCVSRRNCQGIFFCWGVTQGVVRRCVCANNRDFGITIGHRDTDNLIEDSVVEGNDGPGLLVGRADSNDDWTGAHRNRVRRVTFRDNHGVGVAIEQESRDTEVCDCIFEAGGAAGREGGARQAVGVRLGAKIGSVELAGNVFRGEHSHEVERLAAL